MFFAEILTFWNKKDARLLIYSDSRVKIVGLIKLININISQFQLERNATIVGVPTLEKNTSS